MTRTIEQKGEPFSPYGVQFWSSDEGAVRVALNYIYKVIDQEKPDNYTIRLRDKQDDTPGIAEMSFGAAIEAMKVGKKVTRPRFDGIFEGIMLFDQSMMFVKGIIPTQIYTPTSEDLLAMDWQVTSK